LEISNRMRPSTVLLLLIILPISLFAVKPSNKQASSLQTQTAVNVEAETTLSDKSSSKFERKLKRIKRRMEALSKRSKSEKKPIENLLFSSVFLFITGILMIFALQGGMAVFVIVGLAALVASSILSLVAYSRKEEKKFLTKLLFFTIGLPVLLLCAILLIGVLINVIF
jgi:hypothetical protein